MKGRPLALLLLGWSLILTLFRRMLPSTPALARFETQYGAEGILPVSEREHALLKLRYRCTACGACDALEDERIRETRVGYRGLMATVLGGTRSLMDYDAVSHSLSEVPSEAIAAGERACPESVPIVQLVELIRSHGARAQGSLAKR